MIQGLKNAYWNYKAAEEGSIEKRSGFAITKVRIVGHTDADGNDANNLDLSKRRAASVKQSLAKECGIDETRIQTDGRGEGEPIDKNDNAAGKANNRRVEFIKL